MISFLRVIKFAFQDIGRNFGLSTMTVFVLVLMLLSVNIFWLVEMVVTDDSWYVVRNTPNVTGFVGSGTTPTPVDQKEVDSLQKRMGVDEPVHTIDMQVNDPVRITDGPFKNFEGKISTVDETRGKVKVLVNMFGRETPVELDALQVKRI
jgi:transcriptional antiterminator NusG